MNSVDFENSSHIKNSKSEKQESVSVETNTDPWTPDCPTCVEQQKDHLNLATLIDINQYITAINYINSMHSVINDSLTKNFQNSGSKLNVPKHFSMPDLPNFLSILSNFNNGNNTLSNESNNCATITRSTSTTSLRNIHNTQVKPKDEYIEPHNSPTRFNLTSFGNVPNIMGKEEMSDQLRIKQLLTCEDDINNAYEDDDSPVLLSPSTKNMEPQNDHLCDSFALKYSNKMFTDSSQKHINRIQSNRNVQGDAGSRIMFFNTEAEHQIGESLRRPQSESRSSTKCGSSMKRAGRYSKDSNCEKRKSLKTPTLSEAELDRYASELLNGIEEKSCHSSARKGNNPVTPLTLPKNLAVGKPDNLRSYQQQIQAEPLQRKIVAKLKEVMGPSEKTYTSMSMSKQSPRSINSPKSSSVSGSPPPMHPGRNFKHNSGLPIVQNLASNAAKRTLRSAPTNSVRGNMYMSNERKSSIKPVGKTIPIHKPVITNFQASQLSNVTNQSPSNKNMLKRNSNTNRYASMAMISSQNSENVEKNTYKNLGNPIQKNGLAYKVQQNDKDNFLCSEISGQLMKRSSESVIFSDKEEHGIIDCTDSDIFEDVCNAANKEKRFESMSSSSRSSQQDSNSYTKKYPKNFVQSIARTSRHKADSESMPKNHMMTPVPVKKKREIRKQPFRQIRRQPSDNEEIMNITKYISQHKNMKYSDSVSNASHTTVSSDIKSDKELAIPHIFKH